MTPSHGNLAAYDQQAETISKQKILASRKSQSTKQGPLRSKAAVVLQTDHLASQD